MCTSHRCRIEFINNTEIACGASSIETDYLNKAHKKEKAMTTDTSFVQRGVVWVRLGKSLTKALLPVLLVALFAVFSGASAQAQTPDSVCRQNKFLPNSENLDGIWKLSFSVGTTLHVTRLAIDGNAGISVTEYYDSNLRRKRRIRQVHALCQSKYGVVILGYNPTDVNTGQTGRNLTYIADNFAISRKPDGAVIAFNLDDSGRVAEIDIEFIEELKRR